jgi:Rab9 effector protein with kelch motifs
LNWLKVKLEGPQRRRLAHTATQVGSYLFIHGGHDGSNYTSDTLLFNLGTCSLHLGSFLYPFLSAHSRSFTIVNLQFEPRNILGRRPAARGYHVAFLADHRLIIAGGFNGADVFDDVYALELAAAAYLPQVTSFQMEFDGQIEDE